MKEIYLFKKASVALGVILALGLAGCSKTDLYDPNYAEEHQTDQYNNNFNTLIGGTINPNQDWNMSVKRTIAVNVGGSSSTTYTLKLYTNDPRIESNYAKLIATTSAQGGSNVKFEANIPSSVSNLYVGRGDANGGIVLRESTLNANAYSADFASSASTRTLPTETLTKNGDYYFFPNSVIQAAIGSDGLQEGVDAKNKPHDYDIVPQNNENKEIVLYPIYSQTSGINNEVGYILYNSGDNVKNIIANANNRHVIYKGLAGLQNILQPAWNINNGDQTDFRWTKFHPNPFLTGAKAKSTAEPWKNTNGFYFNTNFSGETTGGIKITNQGASVWSKPTKITLNEGQHLIMYVNNGQTTYYSLQSYNGDKSYHSAIVNYKGTDAKLVGFSFSGLEDGTDKDCNDIIFAVYNADVYSKVTDEDAIHTVAFEDLGSTDDYDFNDVVLKVAGHDETTTTYVNGVATTTSTKRVFSGIWLVAAGGTLPTHVWYKPSSTESAIDLFGGEIHEKFGVSTTTMVNTGKGSDLTPIKASGITTWPAYAQISESNPTPGFYITVEVTNTNGASTTRTIVLPNATGVVPQGFYIPYDWSWPTERTNITSAYAGFAAWATTRVNNDWYKTPAGNVMIKALP